MDDGIILTIASRPGTLTCLLECKGCTASFSKIKTLLEKAAARIREALVEAIGMALSAVTLEDAMGFFGHCGYLPAAQPS